MDGGGNRDFQRDCWSIRYGEDGVHPGIRPRLLVWLFLGHLDVVTYNNTVITPQGPRATDTVTILELQRSRMSSVDNFRIAIIEFGCIEACENG